MTKNQIDYWKSIETERANRAGEAETARSNLAREIETNRANKQVEYLRGAELAEKTRSDLQNEVLKGSEVAVKSREADTAAGRLAVEQTNAATRQKEAAIKEREAAIKSREADIKESQLRIAQNDPNNVINATLADYRNSDDPITSTIGHGLTGLYGGLDRFGGLASNIIKKGTFAS